MHGMMLVDGHVHFYPCHDLRAGLDAAAAEFEAARQRLGTTAGPSDSPLGYLVVVDSSDVRSFDRLRSQSIPEWSVVPAEDHDALVALRVRDEARLVIIAGRQLRTVDGLEVLAYGTRSSFADGGSLVDQVEAVLAADSVPVIPWGFGKWLGRRGVEVERLLGSSLGSEVLLADSYTRPRIFGTSAVLETARAQGKPTLAGTDPLPFPGEERRIARFGFVIDLDPRSPNPAEALRNELRRERPSVRLFGARSPTLHALRVQFGMQVRQRFTKRFVRSTNNDPSGQRVH